MKTKPINEELNAASERAVKHVTDEFVNRCVERYQQEQTQRQKQDIGVRADVPHRAVESADK